VRAQFSELLKENKLDDMRALMDELGLTRALFDAASVRNVLAPLLAALLAPPTGDWPTTTAEALASERIRYRLTGDTFNPDLARLGDKYTIVLFQPPSNHLWAEMLNCYKLPTESKEEVKMRLLASASTSGGKQKFMANNPIAINGMSLTTGADGGLEPCCAPGTVTTHEQLINALPHTRCEELVKVLRTPAAAALVTTRTPLVIAGVARGMLLPDEAVTGCSTATGAPIGVNLRFMGSLTRWPARALGDDETCPSQMVDLCDETGGAADTGDFNASAGVTMQAGTRNIVVDITVDGEKLGQTGCMLALLVAYSGPMFAFNNRQTGKGNRPLALTANGFLIAIEPPGNKDAVEGARVAPKLRTPAQANAIVQREDAGEMRREGVAPPHVARLARRRRRPRRPLPPPPLPRASPARHPAAAAAAAASPDAPLPIQRTSARTRAACAQRPPPRTQCAWRAAKVHCRCALQHPVGA